MPPPLPARLRCGCYAAAGRSIVEPLEMDMKFAPLAALAVLSAATCALLAAAPAVADQKPAATQPSSAAASAAPAPVNKKCPVSGDDVDPKGKTVTYKGKTIGFCCNDCIDLFNKNPDKYVDKIK